MSKKSDDSTAPSDSDVSRLEDIRALLGLLKKLWPEAETSNPVTACTPWPRARDSVPKHIQEETTLLESFAVKHESERRFHQNTSLRKHYHDLICALLQQRFTVKWAGKTLFLEVHCSPLLKPLLCVRQASKFSPILISSLSSRFFLFRWWAEHTVPENVLRILCALRVLLRDKHYHPIFAENKGIVHLVTVSGIIWCNVMTIFFLSVTICFEISTGVRLLKLNAAWNLIVILWGMKTWNWKAMSSFSDETYPSLSREKDAPTADNLLG